MPFSFQCSLIYEKCYLIYFLYGFFLVVLDICTGLIWLELYLNAVSLFGHFIISFNVTSNMFFKKITDPLGYIPYKFLFFYHQKLNSIITSCHKTLGLSESLRQNVFKWQNYDFKMKIVLIHQEGAESIMALNCFLGYMSMHKVHLMALIDQMGRRASSSGTYGVGLHTSVQQIKGKSLSLKIFLETKQNKLARVALCPSCWRMGGTF